MLTMSQLIKNTDQAIIVNIFPYWGNVTVEDSMKTIAVQSKQVKDIADVHNRAVWLGETGKSNLTRTRFLLTLSLFLKLTEN